MFVPSVEVLGLARQHLDYLSVRQRLIAENIANSDTPDYRGKDLLTFTEALTRTAEARPRATHPAHFTALPGQPPFREDRGADGWELAPSDNDVVLEQEMIKNNEVKGQYGATVGIMRTFSDMLGRTLNIRG